MGAAESSGLDLDSTMYCRGLRRLERTAKVIVTYCPTDEGVSIRRRVGVVRKAGTTSDGKVVFTFQDAIDSENVFKATISEKLGETSLSKRGSSFWFQCGHILQVRVHDDCSSKSKLMFDTIDEYESGRHEMVAVAADIPRNKQVIQWLEWSEDKA